jgi:hypothetical protein
VTSPLLLLLLLQVIVPYAGNIPGGIKPGMEIQIQGTIPHHGHQG